ncbi:hypothetical protein [Hymenobacter canadensis]|uniref:Lipoprotein n=1 Tax=Hymenobacter canadensis TaxID=2999067 RepID=A0ABY7LUV8_9BACT|nr:hypothetical protein [Hymenobacter canadensis]WBA44177.1 hypothetical protein O3303_20025 [Hymenobacter canadensis]
MTCRNLLVFVGASLCMAGCTEHTPPISYPPAVVQAGEAQRYQTALWSVSTSFLDSTVFWQPPGDSVWRTLEGLVSLEQRLVAFERGAGSTRFEFELVERPGGSRLRLWGNCMRYGPPGRGFQPLVAVWVNQRDGLIDSVLTIHNVRFTGVGRKVNEKGDWVPMNRREARLLQFHTDSPFKRAFLRAHHAKLPLSLQRLCYEKGILK